MKEYLIILISNLNMACIKQTLCELTDTKTLSRASLEKKVQLLEAALNHADIENWVDFGICYNTMLEFKERVQTENQIDELRDNDDRLAYAYMIYYTSNFNYEYLYYFLKTCIQEGDIETAKFVLEKAADDIVYYIHDNMEVDDDQENFTKALDLISPIDPKFKEKYHKLIHK